MKLFVCNFFEWKGLTPSVHLVSSEHVGKFGGMLL